MILRHDRCYWCGTETFAPKKVGESHPKCATVDHIRSKPECISGKEYSHPRNRVNACYECNQRRSKEWCLRMAAGLVHPTEWSIRQAEKNRRREQRKAEKKAEREMLKRCLPCPVVRVQVAPELHEAWDATAKIV